VWNKLKDTEFLFPLLPLEGEVRVRGK